MKRIYIGCSLNNAPDDFIENISDFKNELRSKGKYEVLEFVGKVGGSNVDVFKWDIEQCVDKCDVMIAVCDLPSTGLGIEIERMSSRKRPVLLLANSNSSVSRLIQGYAEVNELMTFKRYSSFNDMVKISKTFLSGV